MNGFNKTHVQKSSETEIGQVRDGHSGKQEVAETFQSVIFESK